MLKNKFEILCQNFSTDKELINTLWEEIKEQHTKSTRHYHTLFHLQHIYKELNTLKLTPILEFAIFYHDIIYDAKRNDNEVQSALLAKNRLEQLTVPTVLNEEVFQLILETKTHEASDRENILFMDADLSILGSSEKLYEKYTQQVRKEYAVYDDSIYFTGRKKILKMFLEKEKIYNSKHFYDKYEKQARVNMLIEYNSLIKNLL